VLYSVIRSTTAKVSLIHVEIWLVRHFLLRLNELVFILRARLLIVVDFFRLVLAWLFSGLKVGRGRWSMLRLHVVYCSQWLNY
jgi:hypothetical protein